MQRIKNAVRALFQPKDQPEIRTLSKAEILDTTQVVLNHLHDVLSNSYGTLGENTIIRQNNAPAIVTKDGLNILRHIKFDNALENDIYQLVARISAMLVDKVGDGSTSAIISARNVFKEVRGLQVLFPESKAFITALQEFQELIEETINLYLRKKVSGDPEKKRQVLALIAGISNNNDFDIGSRIADIMSNVNADSVVKIKDNPSDNSPDITHTLSYGFPVDEYRVAHGVYFTGNNKNGFDLEQPLVFMAYEFMEVHYNYILQHVIPTMTVKPLPIVIIADIVQKEVSEQIIKDAFLSLTGNSVPQITLLTTNSLANETAITRFMDLATYLNCDPAMATSMTKDGEVPAPGLVIGHATKISISPNGKNNFEGGAGQRKSTLGFTNLCNELQKALDETGSHLKIQRGALRNRLDRLNGTNATIYVGGRTQEEKENLTYLVEDSVLACQSVLRNGYTVGSNAAPMFAVSILMYLINNYDEAKITVDPEENPDNARFLKKLSAFLTKYGHNVSVCIADDLIAAYFETVTLPVTKYNLSKEFNGLLHKEFLHSQDEFFIDEHGMVQNSINGADVPEFKFPILNTKNMQIENFSANSDHTFTSVLAPVSTDIEILRASFSIVSLILSSNQYLL